MVFGPEDYSVNDHGIVQLSPRLRTWAGSNDGFRLHWLHHVISKELYHNALDPSSEDSCPTNLEANGVSMKPELLAQKHCTSFSEFIDSHCSRTRQESHGKTKTSFNVSWSHQSGALFRQALPEIFNQTVTKEITSYYGCHFQILSANLTRLLPDSELGDSFLWHRDYEPPQQLHMLVYLSGASDQQGTTHVLDLEATRRAAIKGYSYPKVKDRRSNVDDVFGELVDKSIILKPELSPGGGMILAAPRVLHKGIRPRDGFRDVLLLILMPSPVPWTERAKINLRTVLQNGKNYNVGYIDPFDTITRIENLGGAPDWAHQCEMFPPESEQT